MPNLSERYKAHRAKIERIRDWADAAQTDGERAYAQTLATLAVAEALLLVAESIPAVDQA